ncbi:sodium ion-translocating decarboxylase subunit beta [Calderihabitans maritimus]|uniref:Glutaconyl-CoA decarboxylase subunit beta n=1 Tax=Calderihabitans maritimus TaxID=1246530 RepID=A0A1Z5HXM1_9FIRM|nr:sodium ion-translocating decarboxylase subunit beta [Calderihabitans maritimus]GAW94254.1 Glutaconyl-CoA decarboxylase subunit beta [Calderihabitans maritimus]
MLLEWISKFVTNYVGLSHLTIGQLGMIAIGITLIYLAIAKHFEPLLLIPIGFGIILGNIPISGILREPTGSLFGGLLHYLGLGTWLGIYPPLIFLGIGAMTDFGPMIANPVSILLGAAAQLGIFTSFLGALFMGYTPAEAGSIGIIGGADGPTAIYTAARMAPHLLAPIAVAAYSYIALVPMIQPPIIKLMTSREEQAIMMEQLRPVSKVQKIMFPVLVVILVGLLVPTALPLVGMLMLGNLLKECGVTDRLYKTAANELMNIVTIFLMVTVGASATAERFFTWQFIGILLLGLAAFILSTVGGLIFGKILCKLTGGKINPIIGAAGVSAVPEAARLSQKIGREANPKNFLLMHAMGPNVAGTIGSAVAAGVLMAMLS